MHKKKKSSKFILAIITVVMFGLIGCSSSPDSNTDSDKTSTDDAPVIIDTKFEEVKITQQPERIVALGWGDAETALSLGVKPIGSSDWLAFGGDGVGPWLENAYDTSPTMIGTMEPDYEQIAALEPDLILDVKSSGDEERYKRLSEIATTVGVPHGGENYLTSSEDQVKMIAQALGKVEEGKTLINELDNAFKKVAKENPEFNDQTIVIAAYDSNGFGAYVEGDARIDFATRLGFKTKDEIEALDDNNFFISLADEQLEILDADLTIVLPIWTDPNEITNNELYQKIPSVVDGRSLILEEDMSNAFSTGTIPALLWTIENLTPQLKTAIEGGK